MFSIQSTIIVSLYPFTNILSYIFIGSLICYLISIIYFIKNLFVKDYLSLPSPDAVVKYYEEVIINSVNIHTLMNVIRILNQLMEDISSGKFNTSENIGSCCGGVCGKQ